ncbi:MAG: methylmalonyl-CoA epimerase [Trueperaceae bacterium]
MNASAPHPPPAWAAGLPLDHVAIATNDLDAGSAPFTLLGLQVDGDDEDVPTQHARVRMLRAGTVRVELLAPIGDDGPVARFLAKRGHGLHHLAFRVVDVGAELTRLRAAGVEVIDDAPRPGHGGTQVAFVHPRSAAGVLVELVQHALPDERA